VEIYGSGQSLVQTIPAALHVKLALYLRVGRFTFVSLFLTIVISLALTRSEPREDPFAPYADLWPGAPKSALIEGEFSCSRTAILGEYCVMAPRDGPYSQIDAVILNGLITQIGFNVRENRVTVGDLVLRWGRPKRQLTRTDQGGILSWPSHGVVAIVTLPSSGTPDYFLSVQHISFHQVQPNL
jgi:hypothetical protein